MKKKKAELGKGGKFLIKKEWRDPEGNKKENGFLLFLI